MSGYVGSHVTAGGELEPLVIEHRPSTVVPGDTPHSAEARSDQPRQRAALPCLPVRGERITHHLGIGKVDVWDTGHGRSSLGWRCQVFPSSGCPRYLNWRRRYNEVDQVDRLSRAETQQRTRARVLAAARDEFTERGYRDAKIDAI